MKRKVLLALLLLTLTSLVPAGAKDYAVSDIPLVHLQNRTRYVSNPDQILSAQAVATMDSLLFALEQATGIQTVVVAVTGIEGGDCFEFAYQLGKQAGVGQKERDNGLVILLSTDERCVQFVTGYGLEGVLPDAICKRIQSLQMLPYFKDDNWDAGMVAGIRATCGYLDGSMENIGGDSEEEDVTIFMLVFFALFGGIIGLAFFANWWSKRCPACKKHKLKRISSRVLSVRNGRKTEEVIYQCTNCGHLVTKRHHSDDENYRGGSGPFVGGMGGGFFGGRHGGGGGFSGGSFGGGSFGGGGAGSRF